MSTKRIPVLSVVLAGLLATPAAQAQAPAGAIALDQLDPAPPGDAFFGVPSPRVGGHLVPRGLVMFDYALQPLTLTIGPTTSSVVGYQAYVHAGASFALWDRLLVSASLPIAVAQGGDSPTIDDVLIPSPSSAALGDLRIGLRVRLFGQDDEVFQVGAGGNLYIPTGSTSSFTGEGAVRLAPQLLLGGRVQRFVWSASVGAMFRDSGNPATITYGAGAAVLLLDDRLQIGPEFYASSPIQDGFLQLTENRFVARGTTTNIELLAGARARIVAGLMVGVAAGPGLSDAIGTPPFRALGTIAWAPPPPSKREGEERPSLDADADEILDTADACPFAFGPRNADPKRHGCPVKDRDEDGVADEDDACPDQDAGTTGDAKQRGCPPDRDGDGVPDLVDACADEKGDAGANGCPASPAPSAPPANADTDGDGLLDAADACPREKGAASTDAGANGCPKFVRVTETEITLLSQVKFRGGDPPPVDAASEPLLTEVRDVLREHPELVKIEVQGHTDNTGDAKYNQKVSAARAEAVRKWLVDHGIPADRLVARGYGPSKPIADNKTADGRVKNKRIAFAVLEKK